MGMRNTIKSISPPFLSGTNGEKYMYSFGLVIDAQIQRVLTTILARMPLKAIPSALSYLGSDKMIERGNFETDEGYAQRVAQAFTDWHFAGLTRSIMRQISGWLSPKLPRIKNVDEKSQWHIYEDQGNTKIPPKKLISATSWNWDNLTTWRFWTIIYKNSVGTNWVDKAPAIGTAGIKIGDPTFSIGLNVPSSYAKTLRKIVGNFKPAHSKCQNIIICLDNSIFDENDNTTYPIDGSWGNYHKISVGIAVRSREGAGRYLEGID